MAVKGQLRQRQGVFELASRAWKKELLEEGKPLFRRKGICELAPAGADEQVAGNTARTYIIPVLSKALTILELIKGSERPVSAREIHDLLGYPQATVYRILRTLLVHGVIEKGSGMMRAPADRGQPATESRHGTADDKLGGAKLKCFKVKRIRTTRYRAGK
ncbi:MAG TPA: hypothetical protein DGA22_03425 [Acidobacterium sp.]|nr:hypothetical protein [Acidobacterium sp.]